MRDGVASWTMHVHAGMLEPLAIHADNFSRRLAMLLTAMSGDLMQRIVLDSQEEERHASLLLHQKHLVMSFVESMCVLDGDDLRPAPHAVTTHIGTQLSYQAHYQADLHIFLTQVAQHDDIGSEHEQSSQAFTTSA